MTLICKCIHHYVLNKLIWSIRVLKMLDIHFIECLGFWGLKRTHHNFLTLCTLFFTFALCTSIEIFFVSQYQNLILSFLQHKMFHISYIFNSKFLCNNGCFLLLWALQILNCPHSNAILISFRCWECAFAIWQHVRCWYFATCTYKSISCSLDFS